LSAVAVNSYLDEPKAAVTLQVQFQTLPDGTNYTAVTTLDAAAKKVQGPSPKLELPTNRPMTADWEN
jgi:hypothetical protein